MLAVGIECHEDLRTRLSAGVLHAGLDRRTLPEIDRMPDHMRAGAMRERGGPVDAAVVHADDIGEGAECRGDDVGDDWSLVIGGDDQPDVGVTGVAHWDQGSTGTACATAVPVLCRFYRRD
ncbi:Uncharacterised protein [Mycobacteroides abscessus subsp. abscessus]|nr:Uncharacterised protein [Mycobacteroides abscessus subsp. abscessus]